MKETEMGIGGSSRINKSPIISQSPDNLRNLDAGLIRSPVMKAEWGTLAQTEEIYKPKPAIKTYKGAEMLGTSSKQYNSLYGKFNKFDS